MTTHWYYDPVEAARQLKLIEAKETKMKDEAVAALRELVALKELSYRIENWDTDSGKRSAVLKMMDEYERRKPLAWAEAKRVVAALSAAPVSPTEPHEFKQPGWDHVFAAFIEGAREARANPDAGEPDFQRAADGHTKRVFEEVDPESERRLRENDWPAALAVQPQQPFPHYGMPLPSQFARKVSFTCCGYCRYEEADGELIEQCAACKAIDAATAADQPIKSGETP